VGAHRREVADVFREHAQTYLAENSAPVDHKRVMRDIVACRTAALGGQVKKCDKCGHEEFFYKSCANRHCPKCQGAARAKWLEARAVDLLETRYFHVVFTLPDKLGPIALQNKRLLYGLLFRAASETLLKIAKDPKHLGATIGFLAVLHTWGQRLGQHPHVHCVVPGGGLSPDRKEWISSRKNFFVHVKVLSRVFRGKFLDYLERAFKKGELTLEGKLQHLTNPQCWQAMLRSVKKKDWIVYAKRPFGSAKLVLKYLARYTHRVAISNQRLVSLEDSKVTFSWKDYKNGGQKRTTTLDATEFIRRFLLHVLPRGFQRIRQYGFLANCVRKKRLQLVRELLGEKKKPDLPSPGEEEPQGDVESTGEERYDVCPACKDGRLVPLREIKPDRQLAERLLNPEGIDSS
jgi:hypothetical protein